MTTYNHFITIAIPKGNQAVLAIAKAASRHLDPDVGGHLAFNLMAQSSQTDIVDAEGTRRENPSAAYKDWIVYGSPCYPELAKQFAVYTLSKTKREASAEAILDKEIPADKLTAATRDNTTLLRTKMVEDRDNRWPAELVPTKAQIQAALDVALVSFAPDVLSGLAELGLTLVQEDTRVSGGTITG